ncbi:MAG: N-ethylammeline chlorohydrolase [Phascolarctobacterium sp.]|nr:MAG: N-ethylammeline chlorohydrolase [Phascolarctobacterium sp.]
MAKTLVKNAEIITAQDTGRYFIGIVDDSIEVISKEKPAGYEEAKVIDAAGKIAVPGMVNTHTHAAMTLLRSYADDMVLMDWLQNKIWPAEDGLTDDDIYWGTMLSIAEMLKTGTTCFADMYFAMDRVADAVAETGIRAVLSRGLTGFSDENYAKLEENANLFKERHNSCNGRIRVMLGPHAPYTCSVEYLKKVIATAQNIGSEIHMHLSETAGEVSDCVKQHGVSPIKLMDSLGMFECGTLAAHCVHVDADDIKIMAAKNVRVAHNPQSNLKLASGIAPVPAMLAAGITVGLGTDGTSSNNNLDMLEECRLAAMLHKNMTGDPQIIPAGQALAMATSEGAKALGFKNLGKIEAGQKADIVLYDMDKPYWHPRHDRISLFVYAANACDADTVIIDGKVLMQNGELLYMDLEKIYDEADRRAHRLTNK